MNMAALRIHTNTFTDLENTSHSGKLNAKMSGNGQRIILGDVKNVRGSKSVSFNEPVKPALSAVTSRHPVSTKKKQGSTYKIPPDRSSSVSKKSMSTPFKIFADEPTLESSISVHQSPYETDVPREKEYMKPRNDTDMQFPLPKYLSRVLNHKPFYSIDVFGVFRDDPEKYELPLVTEPFDVPETLDSMLDSQRKDEIAEFKRLSEEDIAEMERMVPLEPLDAEW